MPRYDDGLDDDGYPLEPYRHPYVRGSEAEVGNFKPQSVGSFLANIMERSAAAEAAHPTSDSPIETTLGAAIIVCFEKNGRPLTLASEASDKSAGLLLVPQFKWSIYRSDWAIYNPRTTGALLIECDGKDFHSSDDQIKHDAAKDEAAHNRGYLTMRFSGSQIHRSADASASEIFNFVYGGAHGSHS